MDLIASIGSYVTAIIGWLGDVVTSLLGANGELNGLFPLIGLGIGVSVVLLTVKIIRNMIWAA